MRLFGNLLKSIVGIVGSIVAFGCAHVEEKKTDGLTDALNATQTDDNHYTQTDLPSDDDPPPPVYGPPPEDITDDSSEPLPECDDNNYKTIYGSPENYVSVPEPLPKLDEPERPVTYYGPPPSDVKKKEKIEATPVLLTPVDNHWEIKINAGSNKGIFEGARGEFYIDDKPMANSGFKIIKVTETHCIAVADELIDVLPKESFDSAKAVIDIHRIELKPKSITKTYDNQYRINFHDDRFQNKLKGSQGMLYHKKQFIKNSYFVISLCSPVRCIATTYKTVDEIDIDLLKSIEDITAVIQIDM